MRGKTQKFGNGIEAKATTEKKKKKKKKKAVEVLKYDLYDLDPQGSCKYIYISYKLLDMT